MIITILIAVVFLILLAKAILETIWGIGLIIYGLFLMLIVAPALRLMACVVRLFSKRKPAPRKVNVARAITAHFASMK